jgi:hypothetical protein
MARNGGYQILDLSGRTFTSSGDNPPSAQMKKGTFKALKLGSKPVYVSGLKIETTEYSDTTATLVARNKNNPTSSVGITYLMPMGYYITIDISNDDSATAVVND